MHRMPARIAAKLSRWEHVTLAPGVDTATALARMKSHPAVETAQYNYIYTADLFSTDPDFGRLWGLHNTGQTGGVADADIDAPEAWDITTGDPNIVVAVIDTGVDYNHPDLAANMWVNTGEIAGNGIDDDNNGCIDDIHGCDFLNGDGDPMDDNGHGTHVSGTIAGVGDNSIGVAGVSWKARIMALKFLGANGSGSTEDAFAAINYATAMGARIMNNSWGGGAFDQALLDAIEAARDQGVLFVASAGNSSIDTDSNTVYPAGYDVDNIIAVAATDHNDSPASFTNYGQTSVDLGAPGVNTYSTLPGGGYGNKSGTSMASPHVSGAAALILAQNPARDAVSIKTRLLWTTDHKQTLHGITLTGGRLNVNNALRCDDSSVGLYIISPTVDFVAALDPLGDNSVGNPIKVTAHACDGVLPGATLSASFDNGSASVELFDDGLHGDNAANDGIYANIWYSSTEGKVTITVSGSYPGLNPGTASVSGEVKGADADGDGLSDVFELSIGSNPLLTDTDGDGADDYTEVCYDGDCGSYLPYPDGGDLDVLVTDTDGDSFRDGQELAYTGDPLASATGPFRAFTALHFSRDRSYFRIGGSISGSTVQLSPGPDGGLYLGVLQPASGTHSGLPDGTEEAGIDEPWIVFQTGLHLTRGKPVSILSIQDNGDGTSTVELDFSGWGVSWNGIPFVSLGGGIQQCGTATDGICVNLDGTDVAGTYNNGTGIATMICSTPDCRPGSTYVLDYSATTPRGAPFFIFPGIPYTLHLEGEVVRTYPAVAFDDQPSGPDSWFNIYGFEVPLTPGWDGGLLLGKTQIATGSHEGLPDGTECPGIDAPWIFFQTGMHMTSEVPVTPVGAEFPGGGVSRLLLDFGGWGMTWNGSSFIDMSNGITATLDCDTEDCGYGSAVTLDYSAVTPYSSPTFITGGLPYSLHLEGELATTLSRAVIGDGPAVFSWTQGAGPFVFISGTGLAETTRVTFNCVDALGFQVNGDGSVSAIRPIDVTPGRLCVTTPQGTSCALEDYTP